MAHARRQAPHLREHVVGQHEVVPGLLDRDPIGQRAELLGDVMAHAREQLAQVERAPDVQQPGAVDRPPDRARAQREPDRQHLRGLGGRAVGPPQPLAGLDVGHRPPHAHGRRSAAQIEPGPGRHQHDRAVGVVDELRQHQRALVLAALAAAELVEPDDHRHRAVEQRLAPERAQVRGQHRGVRRARQLDRQHRPRRRQRHRGAAPGQRRPLDHQRHRVAGRERLGDRGQGLGLDRVVDHRRRRRQPQAVGVDPGRAGEVRDQLARRRQGPRARDPLAVAHQQQAAPHQRVIADEGQAQRPRPLGRQLDHPAEQGQRQAVAGALVELERVHAHRRVRGQGDRGPDQLDGVGVEAERAGQGQHRPGRDLVGQRRDRRLDLGQVDLELGPHVERGRDLAPDHGAHRPQVRAVDLQVELVPRRGRAAHDPGIHRSTRLASSPASAARQVVNTNPTPGIDFARATQPSARVRLSSIVGGRG
ncbi:MAG: hypothetical protein IPL61_35135 [Myxococcales bacterium]|nr:hypothetical protein [Myxococcales bacterium]